MRRGGWTLHEMLISLGVMSGVIALAAHAATAQLRFFQNAGELAALRSQTGHASEIVAGMLWGVSAMDGDIVVALDSAIEMQIPVAASFVCTSSPGSVTMAAASSRRNTLASFAESPGAGDRVLALFEDSLGATWLTLNAAAAPVAGAGCAHFPEIAETRRLPLDEPIVVPPGAALRLMRPVRLSLYRGSDTKWYLGMKDWNGEARQFNAIQPVAGPLRPYSQNPDRTGLRFQYRDADGLELTAPVETPRIASVTVVSRATATRFEDSAMATVGLRNAP